MRWWGISLVIFVVLFLSLAMPLAYKSEQKKLNKQKLNN